MLYTKYDDSSTKGLSSCLTSVIILQSVTKKTCSIVSFRSPISSKYGVDIFFFLTSCSKLLLS